jgi:hypothetical protein
VLSAIGDRTVREGEVLSFVLTATDPDGDPLTFSATPLPSGVSFSGSTGEFRFEPDFTQAGSVDLTFTVTDGGSPPLSASETVRIVIVDVPPPSINIKGPAEGTLTRVPETAVRGTVDDPGVSEATLEFNGARRRIVVLNGAFEEAIVLKEGENRILVSATNRAGTGTSPEVRVTLDTIAPQVAFTEPPGNTLIREAAVRIAGTVSEPGIAVSVDGTAAAVRGNLWEILSFPLVPGRNVLTVVAVDGAGNVVREVLLVVRATSNEMAPAAAITSPAGGSLTRSAEVAVAGTVSDLEVPTVTLEVNGSGQLLPVSGGAFSQTVTLSEGVNALQVIAANAAGISSSPVVHVTLDTVPPALAVLEPAAGAIIGDPQVRVAGTAGESGSKVTVNGIAAGSNGPAWEVAAVPLTPGPNLLRVVATDPAGNSTERNLPLTRGESSPPVIAVLTPADGTLTREAQVTLSGTVSDAAAVGATVLRNGSAQAIALTGGKFSLPLGLSEGTNGIRVTAANAGGTGSSAEVHVVVDSISPQVSVTSPKEGGAVFDPEIRVAGTIDGPGEVRVSGLPALVRDGRWEAARVPVSAGPNAISIVAADEAGNTAQLTLRVERRENVLESIEFVPAGGRLSQAGGRRQLEVTGRKSNGETVDLTTAASGTTYLSDHPFIATVDASGVVTAVTNGSTMITARNSGLTATAAITVEAGVDLESLEISPAEMVLRQVGATGEFHLSGGFSDGTTRDLTPSAAGTLYETGDPAVATVSAAGLVTAAGSGSTTVTATCEERTAEASITVAVSEGPGFLRGRVYHDLRGLPLGGATATLLSDGSGPLAAPRRMQALERGEFVLRGESGGGLVRVEKGGYTAVEREAAIPAGRSIRALDARLTPIDPRAVVIPAAAGGQARNEAGSAFLDVPPGSLGDDARVRLTMLGSQGLPGRLPPGWSPATAVDVDPPDLDFAGPATLRLPNVAGLAPGSEVTAAIYDGDLHRWIAGEPARVAADGLGITAPMRRSGPVAFLVPDPAPFVPPLAIPGQPLEGAPTPPAGASPTATGEVVPSSAPPGPEARAVGRIIVDTTLSGPLPSGTVVRARTSERFDLLEGESVVPAPFFQDLILHAFPRAGGVESLAASFPITPSRDFTILELERGLVSVRVTEPGPLVGGTVIGPAGGTAGDEAGALIRIFSGALPVEAAVDALPLAADQLSVPLPEGFGFLGAVLVDLGGETIALPAEVSIPRPAGADEGAQVLVVEALDAPGGERVLSIVAVGAVASARLFTEVRSGGLDFPGITAGGEVLFLAPPRALGFIHGRVLALEGDAPKALAVVRADSAPFAAVTGPAGRYLVAGAAGSATIVTAFDAETGDLAEDRSEVGGRGEAVALDLHLATEGPRVVRTSPAQGAAAVPLSFPITVEFSEPLAPESVTADSAVLDRGGRRSPAGRRSRPMAGCSPSSRTPTSHPQRFTRCGSRPSSATLRGTRSLPSPWPSQRSTPRSRPSPRRGRSPPDFPKTASSPSTAPRGRPKRGPESR